MWYQERAAALTSGLVDYRSTGGQPGSTVGQSGPDNYSHLHNQDSHVPPDEDDDNHGPIESGPLMNEVHLTSKKG